MLEQRPLSAAVIGSGFVGPQHVDAIRRGGYANVVAMGGVDADQLASCARALRIDRATTDVAALIADPDIDIIHVCTPNATHVALAAAAIEAGKHVVIEKPLALESGAAWRLVELAAARHRHAMVSFTYQGYPMVRRAREIVDAGEIGSVRLVYGQYLQDWLAHESDYNWRVDSAAGGLSRAIADIGTHWFNTVEFMTGLRVEAVFADMATFIHRRAKPVAEATTFGGGLAAGGDVEVTSEDAANLLVRLTGGAMGACVVSQVSHGHKNDFAVELTGSTRSLAWRQEQPEQMWLASRDEARVLVRGPGAHTAGERGAPSLPAGHPEGWGEALRDLLRPFYAAIAEGEEPGESSARFAYPTFADGARAVDFVEAARASAIDGRWVPLKSRAVPDANLVAGAS